MVQEHERLIYSIIIKPVIFLLISDPNKSFSLFVLLKKHTGWVVKKYWMPRNITKTNG